MKIELSEENLKSVVSEAIMNSLSLEQRNVLIQNAISYLLTPTSNSLYDQKKSPMQEAFNNAISQVAREVVTEEMKSNSEIKLKIKELMANAIEKMFEPEAQNAIISNIQESFRNAFDRSRY